MKRSIRHPGLVGQHTFRTLGIVGGSAALMLGALHCNIESVVQGPIGVPKDDASTPDGSVAPNCGSALAICMSDFQSTNVSVISLDGKVLSSSIISSGSASPGISAPLSGDVVLPFASPLSGELVLIDRFANSTLTWVAPGTATVRTQLNVGTGFPSNPRDYVEVEPGVAYISRYEKNAKSGATAFDQGDDVIVVDTKTPKITGSIAFPPVSDEPTIQNRPDRLLKVGNKVWVSLQRLSGDFHSAGIARIGVIDANKNVTTFTLDGLKNCSTLSPSPNGKQVIVACSGSYDFAKPDFKRMISESAIVIFDATSDAPKEIARIAATTASFGPNVTHASDRYLLATLNGDGDSKVNERIVGVDLESKTVKDLYTSTSTFGDVGDVRCATLCGGKCFATTTITSSLLTFTLGADGFVAGTPVTFPEAPAKLPPRYMGGY